MTFYLINQLMVYKGNTHIYHKTQNKIMIGMNQLDLWTGGHQMNRGNKYIIQKHDKPNCKVVCIVSSFIELKTKKNRTYKLFEEGFKNDSLGYPNHLKQMIETYFNIEITQDKTISLHQNQTKQEKTKPTTEKSISLNQNQSKQEKKEITEKREKSIPLNQNQPKQEKTKPTTEKTKEITKQEKTIIPLNENQSKQEKTKQEKKDNYEKEKILEYLSKSH